MARTLGEAWRLGWRIRVRCYFRGDPYKPGHTHRPILCDTTAELDMKTLIWTRGEHMPLDALRERMRCPSCGGREHITVWFEVPSQPKASAAR